MASLSHGTAWALIVGCALHAAPAHAQVEPDPWAPANARFLANLVAEQASLAANRASSLKTRINEQFWSARKTCWGESSPSREALNNLVDRNENDLRKFAYAVRQQADQRAEAIAKHDAEENIKEKTRLLFVALEKEAVEVEQLRWLEQQIFQPFAPTPTLLARILQDEERIEACLALRAQYSQEPRFFALTAKESDELLQLARDNSRNADVDVKGLGFPSLLTHEAGLVPRPGAPDRIAIALTSAFAYGNREDRISAELTANVTTMFGHLRHGDTDNCFQEMLDNSFVRIALPLSTTWADLPGSSLSTPTTVHGGRYSVAFGTGWGQADPHAQRNNDCYHVIEALDPPLATSADPEQLPGVVEARRAELYALCAFRAVHVHRFGLQAAGRWMAYDRGSGLEGRGQGATFALTWAPQPWLVISPMYLRQQWPRPGNDLALGISTGISNGELLNERGKWSRMSLDVITIYRRTDDGQSTDVLLRAAPSLLLRVSSRTYLGISLGVQTRLADLSDLQLLANIGLTFDGN